MDDRKTERYTNISQEVRTLLMLIAGPVNHLTKHNRTIGTADRLKLLKMVARNTKRLLRLVNHLFEPGQPDEHIPAGVNRITGQKELRNLYFVNAFLSEQMKSHPLLKPSFCKSVSRLSIKTSTTPTSTSPIFASIWA